MRIISCFRIGHIREQIGHFRTQCELERSKWERNLDSKANLLFDRNALWIKSHFFYLPSQRNHGQRTNHIKLISGVLSEFPISVAQETRMGTQESACILSETQNFLRGQRERNISSWPLVGPKYSCTRLKFSLCLMRLTKTALSFLASLRICVN